MYYDNYIDEISDDMKWTVFQGTIGKGIDLCDTKYSFQTDAPGSDQDLDKPPWPKASWDIKLFNQQCTYANDGTGAGTIKCDGMSAAAQCLGKQDPNNDLKCIGLWADYYKEVARCSW